MTMATSDRDLAAELRDELQDEPFLNKVAAEIAKLEGVRLTEQRRRQIVGELRRDLTVTPGGASDGTN